jgi:hypothetical protein
MGSYFPRQSIEWRIEEPPAFRRLTLSLWGMAVLAGVLGRVIRWGGLTLAGADDWWLIIVALALNAAILVTLATAHLGNFPISQWMWRAPVFGLLSGATEAVVSLLLIALGTERIGSEVATMADWPSLASYAVLWDLLTVTVFAMVLAATVQLVRAWLGRPDRA